MDTPSYYLQPNVLFEPLVDRLYSWPHLIPPATAARNSSERHLPIMESCIKAPEARAAALENQMLRGGPFIEFGAGRVEEVRTLRDRTLWQRSDLLALSRAISDLDEMLRRRPWGPRSRGFTNGCRDRYVVMSSWCTT